MKNYTYILLGFFSLLLVGKIAAQEKVLHNSEWLWVEENTKVTIKGSLEENSPAFRVVNLGEISITDSLINSSNEYIFGATPDIKGRVTLNGNTKQFISGNNINFSRLRQLNSADTLVVLIDSLGVLDTLHMALGQINIPDSHFVYLKTTGSARFGYLLDESNTNRLLGDGAILQYRPVQSGIIYTNLDGVGLTIKSEGNLGAFTEIRRYHTFKNNVTTGSIKRYYEFIPNISDAVSNVGVTYFDNELGTQNEDSLRLWESQDIGISWRKVSSTPNSGGNKVVAKAGERYELGVTAALTVAEGSCTTLPFVNIPQDTIAICAGNSAKIIAEGVEDLEIFWSNGEENTTFIYASEVGQYTITVINAAGCVGHDTIEVIEAPFPVPAFSAITVCEGLETDFSDLSSIPAGAYSNFWDFGDAFNPQYDSSSQKSPSYVYTKYGTYKVKLTLTSDKGCVKTIEKDVVVLPYPSAKFNVENACLDSGVVFTNTSTIPGAAGITYSWAFGDGNTNSLVASLSYQYDTNGTYQVRLIASSNGCKDTTQKTIEIFPNPRASFVLNNACPNTNVPFTNTSIIDYGNVDYLWDFGNGNSSPEFEPSENYTNTGDYTVILQVSSDKGCVADTAMNLVIHEVPVVNFTVADVCSEDTSVFTNESSISAGGYTSVWNFGDQQLGSTSSEENPKYVYQTFGNYSVSLTVTSDSGCTASKNQSITVNPMPNVSFNMPETGCIESLIDMTNTSSIASGIIVYGWNFGNDEISQEEQANVTYLDSGNYVVQLVGVSDQNCTDTTWKEIFINALPVVDLGDSIFTCGSSFVLDAQNPTGEFEWNTNQETQTIDVFTNGMFWVQVTDGNKCVSGDTTYVLLNSAIKPKISGEFTACDSAELTCGYPPVGFDFIWSTGAETNNVSAKSSGEYFVEVTDVVNNCSGADTVQVEINPSPQINLGNDIAICEGDSALFDAGTDTLTYLWSTGETGQTIYAKEEGKYKLTVTNQFACEAKAEVNLTLNQQPEINFGEDVAACDSLTLTANNENATYLWSTGAGVAEIKVEETGVYWCEVAIGTCMANDTITLTINNSPSVSLGNDTSICNEVGLTLNAKNVGATYSWNQGATTQTISVKTSGTYSVTVTDSLGCFNSSNILVEVQPAFAFDLGDDIVICRGNNIELDAGVSNAVSYNWNGPNNFTENKRRITVADSGLYSLGIINEFGCEATDSIFISPSGINLTAEFLAKSEIETGDTVKFVNVSFPSPYVSTWNFGDGYLTSEESPAHPYYVVGTYKVKLLVSNEACSDSVVKVITVTQGLKNYEEESIEIEALYNDIKNVLIYPNPNPGEFALKVELLLESKVKVDFFNMLGKELFSDELSGLTMEKKYNFPKLSAGMYLCKISLGNKVKTVKFIIIK